MDCSTATNLNQLYYLFKFFIANWHILIDRFEFPINFIKDKKLKDCLLYVYASRVWCAVPSIDMAFIAIWYFGAK